MDYFLNTANSLDEFHQLVSCITNSNPLPTLVTGLSHIHKAHFLAALSKTELSGKPFMVLVESENEGLKLTDDINTMAGDTVAALYPAKDITLNNADVISREYEHKRLNTLCRIMNNKLAFAIATPEAAAQLTMPVDVLKARTVHLKAGDDIDVSELIKTLVSAGFTRCDMIEGTSQFSVRGSIIDIFPVNMELPVRTELWGDSIDSISTFDIESQRRIDSIKELVIPPSVEMIADDSLLEKISALHDKQKGKKADEIKAMLDKDIERLKNVSFSSADKYFPLAYDKDSSLFDYTGNVIVCEHTNVKESLRSVLTQHNEDIKMLFEDGVLCKGLDRYMLTRNEFNDMLSEKTVAYFDTFMRGGDIQLQKIISVNSIQLSCWGGEYKLLRDELTDYIKKGYSCVVFGGTEKGSKTLAEDLRDDNLPADFSTNPKKLFAKRIVVTEGLLTAGYDYPDGKCVAISMAGVTVSAVTKPKKKKAGEEIRSLTDINIGDIVVHNSYGIGVFEGVQKLTSEKVSKDYIKIKYAGTDVLYVPVTQLDLISRYIGNADVNTVKLNKLHTDQWQKTKARAKSAAKEMATEMIELYSKRLKSTGYAFPPDDRMQTDYDNHFQYIETDDQMRCIAEIKGDMQSEHPMDRLLCGDVGFGKTEVALRGAFKCVTAGKQCALLCPTTVLAWQHYQTVQKRMDGFPVNIELLSRFKSPKEQKEILKKLKSGIVDMVIGTHRLVQNDVEFNNLGLVIIDEEQRFGVAHKERFKEMFSGVDILTLSATPIPRTLNMAMSGIRDMSVIETPPQDRQPITSYVIEHDWGVIAQAIMKELRRNGQVYYIHNRIESITQCAAKVHELVPEANIGIAHGKMDEDELLEVWRKLLDHEIDILVCTTLIETGVDVPNCNTLIIENADYMGLAQLHQLRGRVGRTNKRAFAYFTFKRGKVLSEIATKRLNAIREFTAFGSGFRIAMRDLEIRGAGSILGSSQSGHLSNVGYDMYLQLLNEAVQEQRGEKPEVKEDCLVDVKIDAYIPEDYISNQAQRIDCYRKIALITNADEAYDVTDELIDRYGEIPKSVYGLIQVAQLRNLAQKSGISEIIQNADTLLFYTQKPDVQKVSHVSSTLGGRVSLNFAGRVCIKAKLLPMESPLVLMQCVLEGLTGIKIS